MIDLPDNIPDLRLVYLNELNCDRLQTQPNNPISQEMPFVIAW
ncbi:hypothetical protein [Nostoc sphaeroides]|uniref:Uncharacterized protein n=1 Tax=Nostoc sphaeroides CCNUC1 TaxID=2653204 RepID=A0A5P8VX68_9NOSO|nr:hypothetical protein [Nostoc sphaeroides]QFS44967.1 hypothetical protein GXM_02442 [Nostoc sphaeroides CCNUC1]